MKLSQKQQGHLIMLFVAFIFGLNMPISKYVLSQGYISPLGLTVLRMLFATGAFWITSLFLPKEKIGKKDRLTIFFGGVFGIVLNQGSFIYGLATTSPVDASIITTASPLFAMIIAALVLKEPITFQKAGGVLVGAAGAIFLVYTTHHGYAPSASFTGNMAVTSGAFFYALYLIVTRGISSKYSSVTLMKWMFLYSTIILLPFAHKDILNANVFHQSDIKPMLFIGFVLFGATYITYMLMPLVQKRIRPTTMAMYNNLQPLVASFVAIMVGQDSFSIERVISAIFILSGVYLVTQSKSKADLQAEKV